MLDLTDTTGLEQSFIFGDRGRNLGNFAAEGDTVTIELDYENACISFTSAKGILTVTGKLKTGLKAVKFIAEFLSHEHDQQISFVE